jgi:peptide/nickel transport system substrate-binding protein
MSLRAFKLRFRRRLRVQRLQLEELGQQTEQGLERNLFRRLERLGEVRRFVAEWLLLVMLLGGGLVLQLYGLSSYYQTVHPAPGGSYTEGILGSFTNANPLYATSPVDSAVSKLLFAGLYTYDAHNQLVGDLAAGPWTMDERGTTYTVHLKPHLTWQDGYPLTAEDVLYTYQVIQNPDAQSPLNPSWQGIKVAAVDPLTITFTLPNPLSPFPYSMTNGIIPKHLLGSEAMSDMRTLSFNTTRPVGAGPFAWRALEVKGTSLENREEQIALTPFAHYQGGAPKLDSFVIHSFRDKNHLIDSLKRQEITAAVGLDEVPAALKDDKKLIAYNLPLTAAVMTFFRAGADNLGDVNVRQALVRAVDQSVIINQLDYPAAAVREPLLRTQLGYNPAYMQAGYDPAAAAALLDKAGWQLGADHLRHKGGKPLQFKLTIKDSHEYKKVAASLAKQWRAVGVEAQIMPASDDSAFQTTLSSHSYDAVLYGISLGTDPDVFVYWDSTQADLRSANRLNFSEYKSKMADAALEAGRTRADPSLRAIKYQPFLQAWQADAPALALYQPRFLYLSYTTVYGLDEHAINADIDRFTNVQNWQIRTTRSSDNPVTSR